MQWLYAQLPMYHAVGVTTNQKGAFSISTDARSSSKKDFKRGA